MIGPIEKQIINELISVFKIFKDVSDLLQGSSFGTFSNVVLTYENLAKELKTKLDASTPGSLLNRVLENLSVNLPRRFKIRSIHILAALLDPGCAITETINGMSAKSKVGLLSHFWETFNLGQLSPIDITNETLPENLDLAQKFRMDMMKKLAVGQASRASNDFEKEIFKYLDVNIENDVTLERFWKSHKDIFPKLYTLASLVFGLPSSSASSESAFSVAGNTVSSNNFHLSGQRVNQQCFVSMNRTFLENEGYLTKAEKVIFRITLLNK